MNQIKMYDRVGSVLRVETVINEPDAFKVRKRVWPEYAYVLTPHSLEPEPSVASEDSQR